MMNRSMKDSGVEWIGKIPNEWNVMSSKYLYSIQKGKIPKTVDQKADEQYVPYISMEYQRRDILPKEYAHINDGVYANKSDIAVLWDGANAGEIFKSKMGVISSTVALLKGNSNINKEYLFFVLKAFEKNLRALTVGMGIPHVNSETIKNIKMPFPTQKEQQKIAAFLDEKVAHIENIIEDTKKSIENLKAYKQSLITETVTKGLDSNVEMKDSGIEWIGEIPNNWNTLKIKYSFYLKGRIGWQGLTSKEYQDEGPYLITGKDFDNGSINWESCTHISEKRFLEAPDIHLQNNDLLITKDGTIGKVAKVEKLGNKRASLNSGVLLIRNTTSSCDENYLYYVLLSNLFWKWYNIIKPPNSTILHLYQNDFKEFSYPLPSMEEQKEIARYLDEKTQNIDYLLYQKEQLITELNSYKKSLIYEYVTGKKEVK